MREIIYANRQQTVWAEHHPKTHKILVKSKQRGLTFPVTHGEYPSTPAGEHDALSLVDKLHAQRHRFRLEPQHLFYAAGILAIALVVYNAFIV